MHIESKRVFEWFFFRGSKVLQVKIQNTAIKTKYAAAVWSKCRGVFLSFTFCQLFLRQKVSTKCFGYENSNVITPDVRNLVHAQLFKCRSQCIEVIIASAEVRQMYMAICTYHTILSWASLEINLL